MMKMSLLTVPNIITTRFVLVQTHHPGNVGAAARAMKTMGFQELVLVSPEDPKVLNRLRTKESASGAIDVLEQTRICTNLSQALVGTDRWCGTGMPHDMHRKRIQRRPYVSPRTYFHHLLRSYDGLLPTETSSEIRISFVFGNERRGLTEEDMETCHVMLGIPTNPTFGSLNLASAVQLIAYDWRQAIGGFDEEPPFCPKEISDHYHL